MNTAEKYVCAYIVESLTGVEGENSKRTHEFLKAWDAEFDHPLLQTVADLASYGPEKRETKDIVTAAVMSYALIKNEFLADALKESIKDELRRLAEPEISVEYRVVGETAVFSISKGNDEITLVTSAKHLDGVKKMLKEKYPDAVVEEVELEK